MSTDKAYRAVAVYPPFVRDNPVLPCKDQPDLFTAYGDRPGKNRRTRQQAAKAVCSTCPVRAACEQWATETYQIGIWGGTDELERAMRRAHARRRRRAA